MRLRCSVLNRCGLVPSSQRKYNFNVYFLYSLTLLGALLLSLPWWLVQMLRLGKYRTGLRERLGKVPQRLLGANANTIWIHAVSVGEVQAISRLAEELKQQLPGWRIVVSTATDTGQKLARQRFGEGNVFYAPLDLPFAVRPYLQTLQPKLLLLAESEFWPNLLHLSKLAGAKIAVVNARVSDRSLPRYKLVRKLLAAVLRNVDLFLAQSKADARRLVAIGAPAARMCVTGNLKFELNPAADTPVAGQLAAALRAHGIRPVLVAGSTLPGEEDILLPMFRAVVARHPGILLLLAPRHPERFDAVASLLASSGVRFQRRSQWNGHTLPAGSVFLLDSIGELSSLYRFADLAFVGGSLVPRGGHNVLEAAQYGVPILVGPHTENFRQIVRIFQAAGALRVVGRESLTATVLQLLSNEPQRKEMGERASQTLQGQQGATARTLEVLLKLLPEKHTRAAVGAASEEPA